VRARAGTQVLQGLLRQRPLPAALRRRDRCKKCRCARDEADKAAAALAARGRTGGRDGSGSGGEYRVYSGALLVLNIYNII
jgi:hypothetical protein